MLKTLGKCALALMLAGLGTLAQAQDGRSAFTGPQISLHFGAQNSAVTETHVATTNGLNQFNQPDATARGGIVQVHAGYGFDLGQGFNLTLGAFLEPGSATLAPTRATFFLDTVQQELRNRRGLYLAPGYLVDDRTLIFAKLGLAQADELYTRATPGIALRRVVSGTVYGVGVKRMLNRHLFWSFDVTRTDYGLNRLGSAVPLNGNSVNIRGRAAQDEVTVGLGYSF